MERAIQSQLIGAVGLRAGYYLLPDSIPERQALAHIQLRMDERIECGCPSIAGHRIESLLIGRE